MSAATSVEIRLVVDDVAVRLNEEDVFFLPGSKGQEFLNQTFLACVREIVGLLHPSQTTQLKVAK
jgi:hypothetical protein